MENLVKHRKVLKYYETGCLQKFPLLFMFLLTVKLVKNSHIYTSIFFIFLESLLKQTFNTKFQPPSKDRKSSYQLWNILGRFFIINCSTFMLKQFEWP